MKAITEFFFDLCNQLLLTKNQPEENLPFGHESLILFTVFELLASLSGRDRTGIQTGTYTYASKPNPEITTDIEAKNELRTIRYGPYP